MANFLINYIKNFYHKNFLKIIAVISVFIVSTITIISFSKKLPSDKVDIVIPTIKGESNNVKKESIIEFMDGENKGNSVDQNIQDESTIPAAPLEEETPIEEDNVIEETPLSTEKESISKQIDNDYLIDLYKKIEVLTNHVTELEKEISILKSKQSINAANSDSLSTLLIELYRIKNIALLGQEFSSRIPALLLITQNHPDIQENLLILKSIKQLPKYDEVNVLLAEIENKVLKKNAEENFEEEKTVSNRLKLNLWDYIKIKKVKDIDENDPVHKIQKIKENLESNNFKEAHLISKELSDIYDVAKPLTDKLNAFSNFTNVTDNLFTIILGKEDQS